MSCKIQIRQVRNTPVLKIAGKLMGPDVTRAMEKIDDLINMPIPVVAVDLRATDFIDSKGVGAFVNTFRRLGEQGREIVFLDPHPFVRTVLHSTNLDRMFRLITSEREL